MDSTIILRNAESKWLSFKELKHLESFFFLFLHNPLHTERLSLFLPIDNITYVESYKKIQSYLI